MATGSARLDTFRQAGESLAGRYFRWRLHPFSVREFLPQVSGPDQALETLMRFGGFPEPLFEGTESGRRRWQNQYFTDLVREDVLEFSRINEVRAMRQLVELLRRRTGSPLSFESLGRDLGISAKTARSYVQILEALHIVFLITPYHRNVARALAKAPKLYFYDWTYLEDTQTDSSTSGARLENLVASHLLKHAQFMSDSDGTPIAAATSADGTTQPNSSTRAWVSSPMAMRFSSIPSSGTRCAPGYFCAGGAAPPTPCACPAAWATRCWWAWAAAGGRA
jgi:predicted AAA+ superfamily ATPase